jgi:hypothetical protein
MPGSLTSRTRQPGRTFSGATKLSAVYDRSFNLAKLVQRFVKDQGGKK